MRVLVTGNVGYLGPIVVRRLLERGFDVEGLDAGYYLHQQTEPMALPKVQYFQTIADFQPAWAYDTIVHLAGLSNDPLGDLDPAETMRVNYKGTCQLMAMHPRANHVFASSCSVYGASEDWLDESSPTSPQTPYAQAKLSAERWMAGNLKYYSILRFGTLFGWAPNFRTDLVVNRMAFDAKHYAKVDYNMALRPILHVEEAAKAIVWQVEHPGGRSLQNVVQDSFTMEDLAYDVSNVMWDDRAQRIDMVKSPVVDRRNYKIWPTIQEEAAHETHHTIQDLLDRQLPFNIRLDAYKESIR